MNGYMAIAAGAGAPPLVAIRVDKIDAIFGQPPNPAGLPPFPLSDGKTDTTTQIFNAYDPRFRGGVNVATGNFDGFVDVLFKDPITAVETAGSDGLDDRPNYLVTAPQAGGGPHIKVWRMVEDPFGNIVVGGLVHEFMAFDFRFTGGVNITTGDLDGDGRAELITGAGRGGGPHVKIWKFDVSDQRMVLAGQFMAYDLNFRGGVSVSSAMGYQQEIQVIQPLGADHPAGFVETPYNPPSGRPGFPNIPLTGRIVVDPLTGTINGFFTVGGGGIQYLGGNLLNNYGNVSYAPNVEDLTPPTFDDAPPEQPLVYANWPAMSTRVPPGMPTAVPVGPFIQVSPGVGGGPPVVTPLDPALGQVNFRNQLITGPGPGGGPIVRIWDFVNDAAGFRLNEMAQFAAFDPSFRGGINVTIADVVETPADAGTEIFSDTTGTRVGQVTFPLPPNLYNQFSPEIVVTTASGGRAMRVFGTTVQINPATGRPIPRTSISQLSFRPVQLASEVVFDRFSPLTGYQGLATTTFFTPAVDQSFNGEVITTFSAFSFDGTAATSAGQYVVAAGTPTTGASRGSRVRIFENLGPVIGAGGQFLPSTLGTTVQSNPIDEFAAFTSGFFPNGLGGVAYGFGQLPMPARELVLLPARTAATVTDPIFLP
jgi:hypothetical protein